MLDWVVAALVLTALWAIGDHREWGWPVGAVAALLGVVALADRPSFVILNLVLAVLYLRGWNNHRDMY